jgi:hypothetical protein
VLFRERNAQTRRANRCGEDSDFKDDGAGAASIIGRTIVNMRKIHPECLDPETGVGSVAANGLVAGDSEEEEDEEEEDGKDEDEDEEDEDEEEEDDEEEDGGEGYSE